MSYIDREAFLKHEEEIYCKDCDRRKNSKGKTVYAIGGVPCRACGICDVMGDVEDYPVADVVEVVRCKDCKHLCVHSGALGVYQCALHGDYPSGEYFCADGERKDGGQDDV